MKPSKGFYLCRKTGLLRKRPDICPACGSEFEWGTFDRCGQSLLDELNILKKDYNKLQKGFNLTCSILGLIVILWALN